jgi:hypothetical protein
MNFQRSRTDIKEILSKLERTRKIGKSKKAVIRDIGKAQVNIYVTQDVTQNYFIAPMPSPKLEKDFPPPLTEYEISELHLLNDIKELLGIISQTKGSFSDSQESKIHLSQLRGKLEKMWEDYHLEQEYLGQILTLLSDAVHFTGVENLTMKQLKCLEIIIKEKLKLGMKREDAIECGKLIHSSHLRTTPSVKDISQLYET